MIISETIYCSLSVPKVRKGQLKRPNLFSFIHYINRQSIRTRSKKSIFEILTPSHVQDIKNKTGLFWEVIFVASVACVVQIL